MTRRSRSLQQGSISTFSPEIPPFSREAHESMHGNRLQWLVELLVFLGVIAWVIAALVTQNFFLLSGVPLLGKELAYAFRRMIDYWFPVGGKKISDRR